MTCALTDEQMLTIWERGLPLGPTERALLALCAADARLRDDEARAWPLGKRDLRLLQLRAATFGTSVRLRDCCPACQAELEFPVSLDEICDERAVAGESRLQAELDDMTIRVRPPDSADAMALERATSVAEGEELLWARCVRATRSGGAPSCRADLLERQLACVDELLASADPSMDIAFDVTCVECGTAWIAPFDVAQLLWLEIAQAAKSALLQVDALACRYGWSEEEILKLGRARRETYLSLAR